MVTQTMNSLALRSAVTRAHTLALSLSLSQRVLAHTNHANPPSMSTNVAEMDPLRAADEASSAGRTGKACVQRGAFRHW
jgi:hypothetical protein